MAKYESIVTIRGTIDGLTFRDTAEGKVVGRKTGPTREKVLTHENFKRTRNNASEFKQAVHDGRLLRRALGSILDGVSCTTLNGHVNGLVHRVCKTDNEHDFGSRCAAGGDVSMLTGFDLNKKLSLDTVLLVQPVHSLDIATGMMKVRIASFIAYKRKVYSKEATHFRMVSGGVVLNFSNNGYSNNIQTSELLPLSRKTPGDIFLEHQMNGKPGDVLLQVVGIQLYKLVNGKEVLVKGGAVRILEAARIPETQMEGELQEIVEVDDNFSLLQGCYGYNPVFDASPACQGSLSGTFFLRSGKMFTKSLSVTCESNTPLESSWYERLFFNRMSLSDLTLSKPPGYV